MHHQYADDSQIYVSATKNDLPVKAEILERCTADVHAWLLQNGLQLNPQKSDVIQFTVGRGRERADNIDTILISDTRIQPSSSIKSLGVTLDQQLTFDQQVDKVCKA